MSAEATLSNGWGQDSIVLAVSALGSFWKPPITASAPRPKSWKILVAKFLDQWQIDAICF
ncbi:hypothetical protein [Pseudomonas ogarae]|uniref:hypothetical protein n=1 Tax=Pseudomonas ogarae (strain DSM 112162 / CECT 30235 / F113) TaxID=1114970 RepID=UPI001305332C|nr:hypothetical protein [Pseudomonas ogarae]